MSNPLSRAAATHAHAVEQMRAEAAMHMANAEQVLGQLAADAPNGDRTFYQGIRSRIDADRVKLLPDEAEDVVPLRKEGT